MRRFLRITLVVAVIATIVGGYWWLTKTDVKPAADSRVQTKVTATAMPLPVDDVTRLQNALNSTKPSKRAEAYAPGAIRDAYKANATSTESGGVTIDAKSFKQLNSTTGEVTITVPGGKHYTFRLAKVKTDAGEQWFLTALKE